MTGREDPRDPEERSRPPRDDAALPAVPSAPTPEDLGLVLSPLKDLAEAFRTHSETLRSLAEGQARIGKRLESSDRSEAIVQSTKALNETFRGVQRTQERLMGRISSEGRRPWALALGLVAVLAVFVGGTLWYLLSWLERREGEERAQEGTTVSGLVTDHSDRLEEVHERLAEKREEVAELERRLEIETLRAAELTERVREKDREIEDIGDARNALTGALRENASLSSEVARLSEDLSRTRGELDKARSALSEAERELSDREHRIAELANGPAPATPGTDEAVGTVSAVPPEAVTDTGQLRRIVTVVNGLLLGTRETESYRFLRVGGARGKVLYDVTAVNVDTNGKETKRVEAKECRIVLDAPRKRAELRFRKGHVYYHGVRAPFWGGKYVVTIVDIDPDAWRRSGLTIIGDA